MADYLTAHFIGDTSGVHKLRGTHGLRKNPDPRFSGREKRPCDWKDAITERIFFPRLLQISAPAHLRELKIFLFASNPRTISRLFAVLNSI